MKIRRPVKTVLAAAISSALIAGCSGGGSPGTVSTSTGDQSSAPAAAPAPAPTAAPGAIPAITEIPAPLSTFTADEKALYDGIQLARRAAGVGALAPSDILTTAARGQMSWLMSAGGYDYLATAGRSPHTGTIERVANAGFKTSFVSAVHVQTGNPADCLGLLMLSESHASALLEPGREVGVAATADPNRRLIHCYAYVGAQIGSVAQAPSVPAIWPVDGATEVKRVGYYSAETQALLGLSPSRWYAGPPVVVKPSVAGIPREAQGAITVRSAQLVEADTGTVVPSKILVRSITPSRVNAAPGATITSIINAPDNGVVLIADAQLKRSTRYTATIAIDVDGKAQSARQATFTTDAEWLSSPTGMPL